MGIGMMVIVAASDVSTVREHLQRLGEPGYEIGRVIVGAREVIIRSS
jgi:phosphoribosylaminoimidazole (AIR) synthetase